MQPVDFLAPVPTPTGPVLPRGSRGLLASYAAVLAACLAGLVAAFIQRDAAVTAVTGIVLWTCTLVVHRSTSTAALCLDASRPFRAAGLAFSVVASATAVGALPHTALAPTLTALLVASGTAWIWSAAQRARRRPSRAILVGDPDTIDAQLDLWTERHGVDLVACFYRKADAEPGLGEDGLASMVATHDIDTVILLPSPSLSPADLQRLSWDLEPTNTRILIGGVVDRFAPHRVAAGTVGGMPVLAVAPSRRGRLQSTAKSALDKLTAALFLVAFTPIIAAAALAVRLESPGPAIFKQRRVGQSGQPFVMYKIRTMRTATPLEAALPLQRTAGNEVLFKMREDPRVTRVGRFLRRYSIDELPQLLNVIRGEMSLIGPRPALPQETEKYDNLAWRRTAVKPGLTGLWQVSGRSDLSWEKSIALDLHYVDNWRLTDDMTIAAKTLGAVVGKKGAY
jgi:exopolysaccharide biosynthesis polyprenyl glycosylphosphotransferase